MQTKDGSAFRDEKVDDQGHEEDVLPWSVGLFVIFSASAVCWMLIYAVFISAYHFLTGSH